MVLLFSLSLTQSMAQTYLGTDAYGHCPQGFEDNTTYISDYIYADVIMPSHMELQLSVVIRHELGIVKIIGGEGVTDPNALDCSSDQVEGVERLGRNMLRHVVNGDSVYFNGIYKVCVMDRRGNEIESALLCNSNTGD